MKGRAAQPKSCSPRCGRSSAPRRWWLAMQQVLGRPPQQTQRASMFATIAANCSLGQRTESERQTIVTKRLEDRIASGRASPSERSLHRARPSRSWSARFRDCRTPWRRRRTSATVPVSMRSNCPFPAGVYLAKVRMKLVSTMAILSASKNCYCSKSCVTTIAICGTT